jgi:hypothetical protein
MICPHCGGYIGSYHGGDHCGNCYRAPEWDALFGKLLLVLLGLAAVGWAIWGLMQ